MHLRDRNPEIIKNGYTANCIWRNRDIFIVGHEAIVRFLTEKWQKEKEYKLRKELFAYTDNKVNDIISRFSSTGLYGATNKTSLDCCTILVRVQALSNRRMVQVLRFGGLDV